MSKRTGEAAKAIREAWKREQQLVSEGKGTRDWTPEEQQSIIDEGKAYDENGKAYIGHHMKSAECYPEYQGDPENIQFLSYIEHQKAHDGDWRNPSNWYYDPVTEIKYDFGENKYIPCEIIELSAPISVPVLDESTEETVPMNNQPVQEQLSQTSTIMNNQGNLDSNPEGPDLPSSESMPKRETGILSRTVAYIETKAEEVADIVEEHPIISAAVSIFGPVLGKKLYNVLMSKFSHFHSSSDRNRSTNIYHHDKPNTHDSNIPIKYPLERSSPIEHDVSGYDRLQHGKTVHVKPYKRGKK